MIKIIILLFLLLIMLIPFTLLTTYFLANYIPFLQKIYCKIGWHCHTSDYIFDYSDGASDHCTCKWCGYKGMVDSQGNLF